MTGPESDPPTTDLTGIAVAIGVIQADQKYAREGVDKLERTSQGLNETVAFHSVKLAEQGGRLDGHDKQFEDRAPVKTSWQSTAMFIIGIASVLLTVTVLFTNR